MNENDIFNWLQEERSKSDLVAVPKTAEKEVVELFKSVKDEKNRKSLEEIFKKIYYLRERKIADDARHKAQGIPTIFMNLTPRENKLMQELVDALTDARKGIFPFLDMSHQPESNHCKPEFSEEAMKEEEEDKKPKKITDHEGIEEITDLEDTENAE